MLGLAEIKVLIWHNGVCTNPYPCKIIPYWLGLGMGTQPKRQVLTLNGRPPQTCTGSDCTFFIQRKILTMYAQLK